MERKLRKSHLPVLFHLADLAGLGQIKVSACVCVLGGAIIYQIVSAKKHNFIGSHKKKLTYSGPPLHADHQYLVGQAL